MFLLPSKLRTAQGLRICDRHREIAQCSFIYIRNDQFEKQEYFLDKNQCRSVPLRYVESTFRLAILKVGVIVLCTSYPSSLPAPILPLNHPPPNHHSSYPLPFSLHHPHTSLHSDHIWHHCFSPTWNYHILLYSCTITHIVSNEYNQRIYRNM